MGGIRTSGASALGVNGQNLRTENPGMNKKDTEPRKREEGFEFQYRRIGDLMGPPPSRYLVCRYGTLAYQKPITGNARITSTPPCGLQEAKERDSPGWKFVSANHGTELSTLSLKRSAKVQ
ncbi:unnamed protein product [Clonostachys rosea]|uniref:Uncharacterized protein n=1 Tax=Bionectria ochroleuca TaxID=29856 RepID=A0ABY6U404_BIOOC|nr:unnamed protein product [Clonostachys rosea]